MPTQQTGFQNIYHISVKPGILQGTFLDFGQSMCCVKAIMPSFLKQININETYVLDFS